MSNAAYEEFSKAEKAADKEFSVACDAAAVVRNRIWAEKVAPLEELRKAAFKEMETAEEAVLCPARQKRREAKQAAYDIWRRTPEYEVDQATRYLK